MAITTLQGVRDGLRPPILAYKLSIAPTGSAGKFVTNFYAGGDPGAAAAPSPGMNGAALTSYAGQIPWQNPPSGGAYIAGTLGGVYAAAFGNGAYVLLCDRLWHNSGISVTTTTEQAITSPTWPARDRTGATDGDGVYIALEVSAALGNASTITNTTLNYTNSAGTSGRTATMTSGVIASAPSGLVVLFELQSGDVGVRSIQGITLGTSYISGAMHLVAFRVLTAWAADFADLTTEFLGDAISMGLPRVYDNAVPYFIFTASPSHNQSSPCGLTLQVAHG